MPVQLTLSGKNPETVVRQIDQNLTAEFPKVGRLKINQFFQRVLVRVKASGKQVTYPIRWASARQRRKVFALLREKGGPPYQRTGQYQAGWGVEKTTNGGRLKNEVGYAHFVGGTATGSWQSPIHDGRWVIMREVFDDEYQKLPQEIQSALVAAGKQVVREATA